MKDQYHREIDYVRISVTDRCNFRCRYCMPKEGAEFTDHSNIMTYEEILRFCEAAVRTGIHNVKITGGEPFVRKGVCGLIRRICRISGIRSVTVTTNGMLLEKYLHELEEAEVAGINVSLDTLDPVRFRQITGCNGLAQVLTGICKAAKTEIPVKINCIPIRGWNEEELVQIASLAMQFPVTVRFIEMMPVGMGKDYRGIPQDEVMERLERYLGRMIPVEDRLGNGPAAYFCSLHSRGHIGFISALSHEFCSSCNRIRLTADGILKPCLNYESCVNLRQEMREGITDPELERLLREAIYRKPRRHAFGEEQEKELKEMRRMAEIGG